MRYILSMFVLSLFVSPANACRTSGPPGPDDCASAYQQSLERLHQEDLRAIQRRKEMDQAQQGYNDWRRQVPPLEMPARPQNLPPIITPIR